MKREGCQEGGSTLEARETPVVSDAGSKSVQRILVGVCTMDRKARSPAMKEILDRLTARSSSRWRERDESVLLEAVIFGDKCILEEPVEEWPVVDCLITFHTHFFPIEKAIAYVKLRRPFVVNDPNFQVPLLDRRHVYKTLDAHGDAPQHWIVDHMASDAPTVVEHEDWIEMDGQRLNRPFVEKPSDGEDHRIRIYYPNSPPYGGGVTHLFRKKKIDGVDRSSEYVAGHHLIRRDGAYIYEPFLDTGGVDLKIYAVGPDYVHVEARKAPTVDGYVERDLDGKELRYPVILSVEEKEMLSRTVRAFKQNVCGIDVLRTPLRSYVCDVNGWSFVKKSQKYYDDAAWILWHMIARRCTKPNGRDDQKLPQPCLESPSSSSSFSRDPQATAVPRGRFASIGSDQQELRSVLGVFRSASVTPREKLTTHACQSAFQDLQTGVRLRSREELSQAHRALEDLLKRIEAESDSLESANLGCKEDLMVCSKVLGDCHPCAGLYRQMVLKRGASEGRLEVVLKWGGMMTEQGQQRAVELGGKFRRSMYDDNLGENLLRLHGTHRHDLQIYASHHGRTRATAAAFSQGLLDLRGAVPQMLAFCVRDDMPALDDMTGPKAALKATKAALHTLLRSGRPIDEDFLNEAAPTEETQRDCLKELASRGFASVLDCMRRVWDLLPSETSAHLCCGNCEEVSCEVDEVVRRWVFLKGKFWPEGGEVKVSSILEVHNSAMHDSRVHPVVFLAMVGGAENSKELLDLLELLHAVVAIQEFGVTPEQKCKVSVKVALPMLLMWKDELDALNANDHNSFTSNEKRSSALTSVSQDDEVCDLPNFKSASASFPLTRGGGYNRNDHLRSRCHTSVGGCDEAARDFLSTPVKVKYEVDAEHPDVDNIAKKESFRNLNTRVRTRLYFTRRSHVLGILLLLSCDEQSPLSVETRRCLMAQAHKYHYLCQLSLQISEDTAAAAGSPERWLCKLMGSTGEHWRSERIHDLAVLSETPLLYFRSWLEDVLKEAGEDV